MAPYNLLSTAPMFALYANAYAARYGLTGRQLGAIAVNSRTMAAHNPNAIYRQPITIEDYLASRLIADPLRLYDCDTHIDGSTALIISAREAARDLARPPLRIEALGLGASALGVGRHEGDFTALPGMQLAGRRMWERTDLTPADLDFAQVYDGFSILTLLWIEALGLCGPGEAGAFVEGGERIGLAGELPLNTSGGQLSAGRFHGYGHTFEACQQLWGLCGSRQVPGARVGVVSNGGFGYGCMVLARD